ncbi:hypothetical protein ABT336_06375 [Micromonospora sp. NPDC000207]|uniref:hypothetical protein n=1 Tax=Micromonospora sp. NPDC000207 TaxID=3154246 RepID=UPI0033334C23
MTGIEFYLDALLSGEVCGVGAGSSADRIQEVLGSGFIDDRRKRWMRRDFGLVEFHFNRVGPTWTCFGSTIQVHRLKEAGGSITPRSLIKLYGELSSTLDHATLTDAFQARGGLLVREGVAGEFVRYRVAGASSFVYSLRSAPENSIASHPIETVWSIDLRARQA